MQSATASDSASAFRSSSSITPWSGRIDPSDLSRPAGLLTAALSQCARERGLSLSEMARAMDVSYWAVSQLRIGIRRLQSLDEDMTAACANFLDRPPLTIHMLAGLLAPTDALATAELTPEDIVHARHLVHTEPQDVALVAPPNRARPLQSLALDELAELHRTWGRNPAVLNAVRGEMAQRPLSRTEILRRALDRAATDGPAPSAAAPASGIMRCSCQTRLRIPHMAGSGEIRCPACQAEYTVHWQDAICVVLRQEKVVADDEHAGSGHFAEEPMPDAAEAWRVLGLKPGSSWPTVERARRSLLQQYHPDRLGHVSPGVQKLAESAFRRVGDAYELLKAQR
jgi:transcriptional regulator with XRE-family HTH domain